MYMDRYNTYKHKKYIVLLPCLKIICGRYYTLYSLLQLAFYT